MSTPDARCVEPATEVIHEGGMGQPPSESQNSTPPALPAPPHASVSPHHAEAAPPVPREMQCDSSEETVKKVPVAANVHEDEHTAELKDVMVIPHGAPHAAPPVEGDIAAATAPPEEEFVDLPESCRSAEYHTKLYKKNRRRIQMGIVHDVRVVATDKGPALEPAVLEVQGGHSIRFLYPASAGHVVETSRTFTRALPQGLHSAVSPSPFGHSPTHRRAAPPSPPPPGDHEMSATAAGDPLSDREFTCALVEPGDYFFVCSNDAKHLRLYVHVRAPMPAFWRYILPEVFLLVVFPGCLIGVLTLLISVSVNSTDFIVERSRATSEEQYRGGRTVQEIFTLYLVPWLCVGLFSLLVVGIAASYRCLTRCCRRVPTFSFSNLRGFTPVTRRRAPYALYCFAVVVAALLIATWSLQLQLAWGLVDLFESLLHEAVGITLTVQQVALDADQITTSLEVLFPPTVNNTSYEQTHVFFAVMNDVVVSMNQWFAFGKSVATGVVHAVPMVSFVVLQLVIFALMTMAIGAWTKRVTSVRLAMWLFAWAIGFMALACGFLWMSHSMLSLLNTVATGFVNLDMTGAEWAAQMGFHNKSEVAFTYDQCAPGGVMSRAYLVNLTNEIYTSANKSMTEEQREVADVLVEYVPGLVNMSIDAALDYFGEVGRQLKYLEAVLRRTPHLSPELNRLLEVLPLVGSSLTILSILATVIDCVIMRDAVAAVLPAANLVRHYTHALAALHVTLFVLCIVGTLVCVGFCVVMLNPLRAWYHFRTQRWYRFHYSFLVGRRVYEGQRLQGAGVVARPTKQSCCGGKSAVVATIHLHRTSLLFCCVLLLDGWMMMMYSSVFSRDHVDNTVIAAQYFIWGLFVVLLIRGLLQGWRKRIVCRITATVFATVVFALMLTGFIQAVVGTSGCLSNTLVVDPSVTELYPFHMSCPPDYIATRIESAVYHVVMGLLALCTGVMQLRLIFKEHDLDGFNNRHHATGFAVVALTDGESEDGAVGAGGGKASGSNSSTGAAAPEKKPSPNRCLFITRLVLVGGVIALALVVLIILTAAAFTAVNDPLSKYQDPRLKIVNVTDADRACNGNPDLCRRRVNEVVWAASHQSYSTAERNFTTPTHYFDMNKQLAAGVRFFMLDLWYGSDGQEVLLCHDTCLLGSIPLLEALGVINSFLQNHSGQVVMLRMEEHVNTTDVAAAFAKVNGLQSLLWQSPSSPGTNATFQWPTLQELVDSRKQLLVFGEPDVTMNDSSTRPEWLHYASGFLYETPRDPAVQPDLSCAVKSGWCTPEDELGQSNATDCQPDSVGDQTSLEYVRAHGRLPAVFSRKMGIVNNFLNIAGIGTPRRATEMNQRDVVIGFLSACDEQWQTLPTVVAVDYWNIENPIATIQEVNHLIIQYGAPGWRMQTGIPPLTTQNKTQS